MDPATSPLPSPSALAPQGDFASVPAPDLLAELIRRRFTGTLRVDRSGAVKVIYFSQGDLACASSNAEEDRLGNLLVRTGRLTREQLSHAKTRQTERSSIGNILVELGYITAAELLEGARRQVEEIVTDLLGWRQGTYQVRAVPLSREVVNLSLPARVLMVRALQKLTDRELVVERLGSLETVLARVEPFDEAARALDFGFSVDPLLEALDGKRSVHEICESLDMEDFQVCKVLYTLLILGLLRRATNGNGRELVFVEGELQNGETLPRADETGSRWGRRRSSNGRETAQSAPVAAIFPTAAAAGDSATGSMPAAEQAPPADAPADAPAAPPAEPATEEIEVALDEEPAAAPPDTRVVAIPVRKLAVRGALALVIVGLVGGIVYFTYFRPTLTPDDVEEERLLAALMDEARQEIEPPRDSGPANGGKPSPSGARAPEAGMGAPPAAAPRAATSGSGGPAVTPGRVEPPLLETPALKAPSAPQGKTPAPTPPAPAHGLEKARSQTMLSADANFRSAMELMRESRFPEAAESFRRALESQDPGTYAIQVLLACQDATLQRAFARAPDRTLYFVATTFRGQACYRLLDGLYPSESEAHRELERLPALFREDGNRPVVVRAPLP